MNNRNFLFFVNPISGTGSKDHLKSIIESTMKVNNLRFTIVPTVANGNYNFLADKIKKEQISDVVICGGDGSINQIGSFLKGNPVRIGIIPMGSGNGLAFCAGIPKNIKKALQVILAGNTNIIDAFTINEHFSCMLSGLGFDAHIAHEFAKASPRGLKTYTRLAISNWILAKWYPFTIIFQNQELLCNAYFISIANANQFGNRMRIAPEASLTDGMLDIIIVNRKNRVVLLAKIFKQMIAGKPVTIKEVIEHKKSISYFRASSLIIKNETLAPLHIDGEPIQTSAEFTIQVIPSALTLIMPKG